MTFYEKMRIVCFAIPQGKVATYGQIAMLCGKPKNPGRWDTGCGRIGQAVMYRPFGWSTAEVS